jgi:acetyltransferase-like isoleucine patch superfamily enzyme
MTKNYFISQNSLKKKKFRKIGKNCKISNKASFIGEKNISIGDNVRIDDYVVIVAFDGNISIGSNTHIGALTYILGSGGVKIGNSCNISQGVKIYSKSDNYKIKLKKTYKAKVSILDNCIIGSGAVILPGSKLNKNVRIGALTIVNKEINSNYLYFGNRTKKLN